MHITPGCVSCGTCESLCPAVFKVDSVASIIEDADLEKNEALIEEAVKMCPVAVIKYEEET